MKTIKLKTIIFVKMRGKRENLHTNLIQSFTTSTFEANRLERNYLWSGLGDEFKFNLVNWKTVCSPTS